MHTMKKYLALALALLLCLSVLWGCGKKDPQPGTDDQTPQTDDTNPEGDPVVTLSDTLECCDGELGPVSAAMGGRTGGSGTGTISEI